MARCGIFYRHCDEGVGMKAFLGAIVVGVVASGSALAADLSLPVARAPVAAG
jgi:hypothetical protein